MKRVLSGITPSGKLHIGNYFGAIAEFLNFQKNSEAIYFIADLHALTTVKDPVLLNKNILDIAMDYLSLGLDPSKSIIFCQSDVYQHPYMSWILSTFTSVGLIKRAHAFKDKLEKNVSLEDINMGLFSYPVLMAADILLYKPDIVPVGVDQKQHIEITRDIADSFNKTMNVQLFKLPEEYIPKTTGNIIGTDSERKMSKSLGNIIGIFDSPEVIKKQIMACVTDPNRIHSYDSGRVEGNVIFVYHDLLNSDKDEVKDLKKSYTEGKVGDVEVKEKLFIAHQNFFADAIKKRKYYEQNINEVESILKEGAIRASKIAEITLNEVKQLLGI